MRRLLTAAALAATALASAGCENTGPIFYADENYESDSVYSAGRTYEFGLGGGARNTALWNLPGDTVLTVTCQGRDGARSRTRLTVSQLKNGPSNPVPMGDNSDRLERCQLRDGARTLYADGVRDR